MRKFRTIASAILVLVASGCVHVPPVSPPLIEAKPVLGPDGTTVTPQNVKAEMANLDSRPIGFSRVQTTIPRGAVIGEQNFKPATCWSSPKIHYDDDRKLLRTTAYGDIFFTIFTGYGYRVAGNPNTLFEGARQEADLLVGANITKVSGDMCRRIEPGVGGPSKNMSGTVSTTINWQVFDPARRRVIWQKDIEGTFTSTLPLTADYDLFIQHAFADAANKMAADATLRALLLQKPIREAAAEPAPKAAATSRRLLPRQPQLSGNIDSHIDRLRGATVLIESGNGHGSGFLVHQDGFVITNQHVVGAQRFVRVRLVSGRTVIGEVLNWDDRRDIALVKLEGSGYPVIPIRETPVRVTEEVFAIGAPREQSLGWTVTRGAISAYRQAETRDRLDLIQSDVSIHGGNSGGPLVDRHGNVVAVCVSGVGKSNMSLNFFIPIMDGLEKLGVELVDPAAYERARRTAAAN